MFLKRFGVSYCKGWFSSQQQGLLAFNPYLFQVCLFFVIKFRKKKKIVHIIRLQNHWRKDEISRKY